MSTPGVQPPPARAERRRDRAVGGPDETAGALPDRAGDRRRPRQPGRHLGLLALERRDVLLERLPVGARVGQQLRLARARRRPAVAPLDELALDGRDLGDLGLDHLRDLLRALLEPVEALGGGDRLDLRVADAGDDPRVLRRGALHELGLLEQVGEAVRLEHDGHHVGRVLLVELDEPVRELDARFREPAPQPREVQPLAPQVLLDLRELGALGLEVGLEAELLGLEDRDVGLQGVDPAREGADLGGQDALAPPVRLDLLALLLDAALQRLRALAGGDQRKGSPQRERKHRHHEQEAESTTHGRAMLGALRRRDQRSALVMERARNPAACRSFP